MRHCIDAGAPLCAYTCAVGARNATDAETSATRAVIEGRRGIRMFRLVERDVSVESATARVCMQWLTGRPALLAGCALVKVAGAGVFGLVKSGMLLLDLATASDRV